MESYMADYGYGFMVFQNLRQAYLQKVGLTQTSEDHDFLIYFSMTYFMTVFKADSRFDKHPCASGWEPLAHM